MVKKPAHKKPTTKPQPEPAQLKAVERLLDGRDYAEAVRRIRALLVRFPDHGGLHRLLVGALERAEGPQVAAVAAFAWAERRPNSLPAQEALLHFAKARGHVMLAARTARQVRALGGETPGHPLDPALLSTMLVQPNGSRTSREVMERFDIGKLHLEGQDFAGALRWLGDLDVTPARNNAALARFHLGQIEEAAEAFLANWQRDPENLFALGYAARLRLYRGDADGARGLCTPLAAAQARRLEDAFGQVEPLLLLGENQSAWDAFKRAAESDWFELGDGPNRSRLCHYGACAAARLGLAEDARRWWRAARSADLSFQLPTSNLNALDRDGKAPPFPAVVELHQALPMTWIRALRTAKEDESLERLGSLGASNAYLKALYLAGEEMARKMAGFALRYRAARADADAAKLLRELARLPAGTKEERFGFLSFLQSEGLLGRDETVAYWDGEALREVRLFRTEIYREPADSDLPPALLDLLGEGIELTGERRLDEAEACFQSILRQVPDHPVALGNLAAVRSMQGRKEEATALLREVVAKHPDYLFARCNLAKTLIFDGRLDEAEALLKGLAERERMHVQDAFALYGALVLLHRAKGDEDAVQSFLRNLEAMAVDEDDRERLAQVRRLLVQLDPERHFEAFLKGAAQSGPMPKNPHG